MQGHDQKEQDTAKLNRRKFLTRAGAGLVIASLPAKSVWASQNLCQLNSIVASCHGSDFAGGKRISLKSSGFFGNAGKGSQASDGFGIGDKTFFDIFHGYPLPTVDLSGTNKTLETLTIKDVVTVNNKKFHGEEQVNRFMVATYLNAIFHGSHQDIFFPVIGSSPTFTNADDLANYLYESATLNPTGFGLELKMMFAEFGK